MVAALSSADVSGMALGDNLNPLVTAIQIGNMQVAKVAQNIANYFPSEGALHSTLRITSSSSAPTLVTVGPGHLIAVSVVQASTDASTGRIFDSASVTVSSLVDVMVTIPSSVGFYSMPFPFANGLAVFPSTSSPSHVVSIACRHSDPGSLT